jgi:hypothetical protein
MQQSNPRQGLVSKPEELEVVKQARVLKSRIRKRQQQHHLLLEGVWIAFKKH